MTTEQGPSKIVATGDHEQLPSRLRRRLGDLVVTQIWLRNTTDPADVMRIEKSFPEADVWKED